MQLTPFSLDDDTKVRATYSYTEFESLERLVVIHFAGEYGIGCKGNDDAVHMRAAVVAAVTLWDADLVVLDFTNLAYTWGDLLTTVVTAARVGGWAPEYDEEDPRPVAVVLSPLNELAVRSLFEHDYGGKDERPPSLATSIEEAVRKIRRPQTAAG